MCERICGHCNAGFKANDEAMVNGRRLRAVCWRYRSTGGCCAGTSTRPWSGRRGQECPMRFSYLAKKDSRSTSEAATSYWGETPKGTVHLALADRTVRSGRPQGHEHRGRRRRGMTARRCNDEPGDTRSTTTTGPEGGDETTRREPERQRGKQDSTDRAENETEPET